MYGQNWRGKWVRWELPRKKGPNGRLEAQKCWEDTIGKEGVVLMRGAQTQQGALNAKTLQYLSECPEACFDKYDTKARALASSKRNVGSHQVEEGGSSESSERSDRSDSDNDSSSSGSEQTLTVRRKRARN